MKSPNELLTIALCCSDEERISEFIYAVQSNKLASNFHAYHSGRELLHSINLQLDHHHIIVLDDPIGDLTIEEIVAELKQNKKTRSIPVLVLSEDVSENALSHYYSVPVNAVIRKPLRFSSVYQLLMSVESFWSHRAVLPFF